VFGAVVTCGTANCLDSMTISLIPRPAALAANRYLAHAVVGWQRACAPDDGEAWWTAEVCDAGIEPDPALRVAESVVVHLPMNRVAEEAKALGPALGRMATLLGASALTFLHAPRNGRWPARRRSPTVLRESAEAFRVIGAGKGFDGAIRVPAADAGTVVEPLVCPVRMDVGYGPVFIAMEGTPVIANLCQYVNLHVDVYDAEAIPGVREAAREAGFVEPEGGMCYERETDGAIPGRRLVFDGAGNR
jgi:hypothetical protein